MDESPPSSPKSAANPKWFFRDGVLHLGFWLLLAMYVVFRQSNLTVCGKDTFAQSDLKTIKTGLLAYTMKAGGYPTTEQGLRALVMRPESEPRPLRWKKILQETPRDPWGHEFVYVNPGVKKPDSYDLFSVGKDGKPNTEDDIWP